jgi:hypothetical protein
MNNNTVTPFQELEAMLLFAPDVPPSTVGEVMVHLQNARVSLAINQQNLNGASLTIESLVSGINPENPAGEVARSSLFAILSHMTELAETVDLAITRDIVVMETWLNFMARSDQ